MNNTDALLVTDIQIDFLPGGALPVANGDQIIPVINGYIQRFEASKVNILASRDWHPPNHISFKAQGGPWPPHCVQNTKGAEFSPSLKLPKNTVIISKATDANLEAYSAFDGTPLAKELQTRGIKRLFVSGLATDYCVFYTVLDACKLGLEAIILMDATLGINVKNGDVDKAVKTMLENGAQQATTEDFPDVVDSLPTEKAEPDALEEKPSLMAAEKKKARMRPRGSNKRIKTERG